MGLVFPFLGISYCEPLVMGYFFSFTIFIGNVTKAIFWVCFLLGTVGDAFRSLDLGRDLGLTKDTD